MAADDARLALSLGCSPQMQNHRRRVPAEPALMLSLSDDSYKPGTPKLEITTRLSTSTLNTVSSFSTVIYPTSSVKREKVVYAEEADVVDRVSSRTNDEDEDGNARKKLRLTKEQSALLEDRFKDHSTLNPKQKQVLAKQLNLRTRQVEVWFQNRRARTKLKQTEVDCEFLKRCCETLTDENRRLQKEVNELRAIKLAPMPPYMPLQPAATTLTVCPSCERVAAGISSDRVNKIRVVPFVLPPNPQFFCPFTHSAAC